MSRIIGMVPNQFFYFPFPTLLKHASFSSRPKISRATTFLKCATFPNKETVGFAAY
jgi:hypothetical protein